VSPEDYVRLLRTQADRIDAAAALSPYLNAGGGDFIDLRALADDLRGVAEAISAA